MAKVRLVRRVKSPEQLYFDEQLWPIYIALVVLGCFSMGVSLAYLKFSGVPWYANAWTSLIGIAVVVAGFMVAFRLVDNRWIRRSMQLSIVLCAILHVGLIVQLIETRIYVRRYATSTSELGVLERRPPKVVYEYHASQMLPSAERPLQDFERPVPTQTPDPIRNPDNFPRQAPLDEEPRSPLLPQPVPVPENVPTTEPNVVHQNRPNEVAPRQAPQPGLLSRQLKPSELKTAEPIEVPAIAIRPNSTQPATPSVAVTRAPTGSATAARIPQEPTTITPSETAQVARRADVTGPAEVSATPTLPRQVGQPSATPRTQIATGDTPSIARAVGGELAPANTAATGRVTASPAVERRPTSPSLEIAANPSPQPQRRDNPAEVQPGNVAQTPLPVPNRQPRSTLRTDAASTAAVAGPEGAAVNSTVQEIAPRASQLERATTQVTAVQPSVQPASGPRTTDVARPSLQITRAGGRDGPTATSDPFARPTLTRQSGAPSLPNTGRTAEVAVGAFVGSSDGGDVSPTSTATRRQATTSSQAGPRVGEPSPAQVASLATQPLATPGPPRRAASGGAAGGDSPMAGPGGGGVPVNSRSTNSTAANVVTTVGDVPANAGPGASGSGALVPAATAIARQGAGSSGASGTSAAGDAAGGLGGGEGSARSRVSLAGGGPGRAQFSGPPSIDPTGAATASPRRAATVAAASSAPIAVESLADPGSPAGTIAGTGGSGGSVEGAGTGFGAGTAQPSRLAVARGSGGIAGGGHSPNLGGSLPGGGGPALVASGSARRAESTQSGPAGDALAPGLPPLVTRARAGGDIPTSSVKAEGVEFGAIGGAEQVGEITASAGAALARGDSNAPRGAVTAAKGTGDVDLGPTQLVAEPGTGRGGGGGQPELSFGRPDLRPGRSSAGGGGGQAPLMALASTKVGDVAAPEGAGGGTGGGTGTGELGLPGPAAVSVARAGGGILGPGGGGSGGGERGPTGGGNAGRLAEIHLSRADASDGGGGEGAGGTPGFSDEEEKQRRLARAATGGGPALAIGGAIAADVPASPSGAGGDGGFPGAVSTALPAAVAVARGNQSGGAAAGGAPLKVGEPGEVGAGGGGGGSSGTGSSGTGSGGGAAAGSLNIARAEASDGPAGEPIIGGGTGRPSRAATGSTFAAGTVADTVSIAGAPASGGSPDGAPLEAQGLQASRVAGGAVGPLRSLAIGAAAGNEIVDAARVGPPGDGVGRRQASPSSLNGPAIDGVTNHGAPGRVAGEVHLTGSGTNVEVIPEVGPRSSVAQAEADHGLPGAGQTPMGRQAGAGLTVNIEAPDGPGGLGGQYSPEVGLNSRFASAESMQVQIRSSRFVKNNVGGLPSVSSGAIVSGDAFISRGTRDRGTDRGSGGRNAPDLPADNAIELGLAFLARYQLPDGGWSLQGFPEGAQLQTDTAATALAVIAFQGAGYNHREFRYKDVVRGGLDFLIQTQKDNGDLFVPLDDKSNQSVWLYSHSLAAIAVCEAYGMTHDPALREPAQKAIDFIVAGQHESRGGWRYSPGVGADTSVTGWMMMALKSGQLAGLEVPTASYAKIGRWLDAAQQSAAEPHLYRYNPEAPNTPEQRHGRVASKTMTSVGLLMRLYTGWRRDNPNMIRGAQYLAEHPPAIGTARDPQRDTYYWYYATQVMAHMGGEHWQAWNSRLHPLIVNSQIRQGPYAGSWDPQAPLPDRWGPHAGRLYVTTMNLLSLEVQYRKLPLYEDTVK